MDVRERVCTHERLSLQIGRVKVTFNDDGTCVYSGRERRHFLGWKFFCNACTLSSFYHFVVCVMTHRCARGDSSRATLSAFRRLLRFLSSQTTSVIRRNYAHSLTVTNSSLLYIQPQYLFFFENFLPHAGIPGDVTRESS